MRSIFAALVCSGACAHPSPSPTPIAKSAVAPVAAAVHERGIAPELAVVACGERPLEIGRVADAQLNEISGVVESRKHPELLFVHNDSGDSPRFFAIDRRGRMVAELLLPSVPLLIDAEEIALGAGPGGESFIYLGDTGNNFASFGQGIPRRKAVIYRVPEPDLPPDARSLKVPLKDVFPIVFTFPRGARDVEAFFIDPSSGDLYLISKQSDARSQLLTANAAMLAAGGGELRLLGELSLGQPSVPGSTMPTAASVSRDGRVILVRTYESVLRFRRAEGESIESALARKPEQLVSPHEPQGEAISFVDGDAAFLTISEGVNPPIHCAQLPP
jgi:hypothetical protein